MLSIKVCMKAIIFALSLISFAAFGQSEKSLLNTDAPSSLHSGRKTEDNYSIKSERRKSRWSKKDMIRIYGGTIESPKEYVARMERTASEIQKRERLMKKPQYANPLYFGHKRLPKKHKAGHLKFCKECGIRH